MVVKGRRTKTLLNRLIGLLEIMTARDGFIGKDIKHIEQLKVELKRRKII